MALRPFRPLRAVAAGVLGLALAATSAPGASAASTLVAFASVESTPTSCQSTVITRITGSSGVRYYIDGHRLRLPSAKLRFDEAGAVEVVAKAKGGATLDRYRYRVLAPDACFGNLRLSENIPRYQPVVSWCTSDAGPSVAQAFMSDENLTVDYTVVRRSSYREVTRGQAEIGSGEGEVTFPVPAGLPRGRYLLEARDTTSAPSLYPWSMWVEELRCLDAPKAKRGKVTFTVPKHGPGALLTISVAAATDPVQVVEVQAGHAYTFHTDQPEVSWVATPTGDHIGELGHGSVVVPQS